MRRLTDGQRAVLYALALALAWAAVTVVPELWP